MCAKIEVRGLGGGFGVVAGGAVEPLELGLGGVHRAHPGSV